jgi:5-methylcytosine-specific restriction endonuclease McrA
MLADDFETTEDLMSYTKKCIIEIGICETLKENKPEMFIFFKDLFQRHPEAIKKEVYKISDIKIKLFPKVNKNKQFELGDYQFVIIKENNVSDTISWVKCVKQEKTPVQKLLWRAMRASVNQQIHEFRMKNQNVPCNNCNTKTELSVDHIIKFTKLMSDFLIINPNHPVEFSKNHISQDIFKKEDFLYEKSWQDYHKKHATLQILCVPCNKKKEEE